jgi:glycosyltransferase involved in cell wall biosynthesis
MSALHIAVDCRVVDPRYPGVGRAALETARALAELGAARCLSLLIAPGEPSPAVAALGGCHGVELVDVGAPIRTPADQWALPRLLRKLRPDVYHATYFTVPALVPSPMVVTIYDLIPRLFPQYWPNGLIRSTINAWMAYAARRAVRVIACSHNTANDIARLLPAAIAKVRVVPLGVSPWTVERPHQAAATAAPYLLYVGSNKPHKNLPRLVAAFARIAPRTAANLIVAGAWDARYPEAMDEVRRRRLDGRVSFEHQPSPTRLADLYMGATGFIFPSLYEGFGLPIIEAMAAGAPVATTDRGSLREVAGDAALLFDPTDESAIAAAMARLLTDQDLRTQLSARGRARAALFAWSRTAQETWAVYEEVASLPPRRSAFSMPRGNPARPC